MNTRKKNNQRRVNRRASPLLSRTLLCLFAGGAVLGIGSSSIAQVRPDAGTILDSTRQPGQPLPQAPLPVLPSSPGAPAMLADDAKIAVTKFQIEGAKLFSVTTLEPLVADLVGKSLNLTQLRQAAERITRHYEAAGYFLSRAVLPQQEWREGVVRIRVVEAAYGAVDIKVQQAPSFMAGSGIGLKEQKARAVLAVQGISPGQPVERGQLERGLYLLNELPGIRPATTLNPGTSFATSDVQVAIDEVRPLTAQIGLDTLGNRYTGRTRFTGSVGLNSPLGIGDRLAVAAAVASGSTVASADYSIPVGHDGVRLAINASGLDYKLCCTFAPLGAKGRVSTAGANLSYPLILSQQQSLLGSLGIERRRAVDDTAIAQTADRRISAGNANLAWTVVDGGGGVNRLSGVATFGKLDLSGNVLNATGDSTTAQTQGHYSKLRTSFMRVQNWSRHQVLLRLSGQWASKNLDSSEKMSLGGYDGVRAYPQGEAAGDHALLGSLEYAYTLPVDVPGRLAVSAFVDSGRVRLNNATWAGFQGARTNLPNGYSLSGLGLGLNWALAGDFSVNLNVATKLGSNPGRSLNGDDADGSASRTRWWMVLSKSL